MKLFPETPQLRLTYNISLLYGTYCSRRAGWKGKIFITLVICMLIIGAWMTASARNPDFPDFELLIQDIIILGAVFGFGAFLARRSKPTVQFYDDHLSTGPKRGHLYRFSSIVKIERIPFEGSSFFLVTFPPKNKWLQTGYELGLEESADLDPLIAFLESKGLLVTKSI